MSMAEIWNKVEKLYQIDGSGSMGAVETITTGSWALDEALGLWGLPKGRIIQYAGKESSGKTLMSLIAIREWQKLDPKNWAIFIDAEYTYNKDWAIKLGVDNAAILQIFPLYSFLSHSIISFLQPPRFKSASHKRSP